MKCTIPEISWHNRDPVLSIDIQPSKDSSTFQRLATGGTDSHVVIWHVVIKESGLASVEVVADLQRHQRAVNTVRFSPSGRFLASGDDESAIILWKQKTDQDASEFPSNDSDNFKEHWVVVKFLRCHTDDVYDLSWSSDSQFLISGSIDNSAVLWDVQKGRHIDILSDHGGFVQGVAWDPKNQYVATLGSDRTLRLYNTSTKKIIARTSKAVLPTPEGTELEGKVVRLFHDDTLKSFFRRLQFSPDGELLAAPSGFIEMPNSDEHCNATYIFCRNEWNRPSLYLPSPTQYTVAVRFCPLLFTLRAGNSVFALPYRMILAVATQSNVLLYDTQQPEPFALISNIHYTRLTDLSWSSDGRILIVSSTDGYCSIITFSPHELGEVYKSDTENESVNSSSVVCESNENEQCKEAIANAVKEQSTESSASTNSNVSVDNQADKNMPVNNTNSTGPKSGKRRIALIPVPTVKSNVVKSAAISTSNKPPEKVKVKRITPIPVRRKRDSVKSAVDCLSIEDKSNSDTSEKDVEIESSVLEQISELNKRNMESNQKKKESSEDKSSSDASEKDVEIKSSVLEQISELNKKNMQSNQKKEESCELMDVDMENENEGSAGHVESQKCKDQEMIVEDSGIASNKTNLLNEKISDSEISSTKGVASEVPCNSGENLTDFPKTPSKSIQNDILDENKSNEKICENSELLNKNAEIGDEIQKSPKVKSCNVTPIQNRTPRRVQFITIASPKSKKKLL